ncbi:MAG: Kelch repeat-containing protein, partial [Anaerolineales bacterium]
MKTTILTIFLAAITIAANAQTPWTRKANAPIGSSFHASSVLDGKIYKIGGIGISSSNLQVFDPVSNSWKSRKSMWGERIHPSSCVFNDKILVIGGTQTFYQYTVITIEEYDPATNTWTCINTKMPRARRIHASALVNGKIYIIGGSDEQFVCFPEVDVFDPTTNEWTSAAAMPTPRMCLEAVALDNKIYVIGGNEGLLYGERGETTVEMYDPETDTWTTMADMNIGRRFFAACALNGKIYVFGGAEGYCGPLVASGEVYDPETDSWRFTYPYPRIFCGADAVSLDEKIFVSGGTDKACPSDANVFMYEYDPVLDLVPLIEKIEVNKIYAEAGSDSVMISVKMDDPTGITLYAVVQARDGSFIDSLRLFDDGLHEDGIADDSIYANTWPVITTEHQYDVHLHITRVSEDTVYNQVKNMDTFTSIGPLSVDHYNLVEDDFSPNPGDRIYFELALHNDGSTETAREIKAEIYSLEPLVEMLANWRLFDDIAAGEVEVSKGGWYYFNISETCPIGTEAKFQVDIFSGDYLFWTDTFSITVVEEPDNVSDI